MKVHMQSTSYLKNVCPLLLTVTVRSPEGVDIVSGNLREHGPEVAIPFLPLISESPLVIVHGPISIVELPLIAMGESGVDNPECLEPRVSLGVIDVLVRVLQEGWLDP
jgi:hypothetical protein